MPVAGVAEMTFSMTHTCRVCGAETSVEQMVFDIIDDQEARRALHDVLSISAPLGGMVLRYLRLHKPAKQGMRWQKLRPLLMDVLGAIQAGCINRKGRDWAVGTEGWKAAFEAVFDAQAAGTLRLPLQGNAYLYEIALRLADQAEAHAEKQREADLRGRSYSSAAVTDIAAAATSALQHKDPALAKIDADRAKATPMPAEVREKLNRLKKGA